MKIDGRCHCGAISYEAEIDPAKTAICNCTDCQSLSGSAFRTILPVAESAFKLLSGTPKTYVKTGDSGNRREQTFCGECGSPLYAAAADSKESRVLNLRVGTIRQRAELIPRKQYWHRSALSWLAGLDAIEKFDKQ